MNASAERDRNRRDPRALLVVLGFMALTAIVYWPALSGGYLFDDFIYFVDNADVHVTTLRLGDWIRAALAQSGINPLLRPLGSLSFALNYYLSGLDPFWPKLTNVGIHLLNGLLLYCVLRELFALLAAVRARPAPAPLAAAIVAGAWLLLPINLTGVAYVSQRMEALATVFVFLGLIAYLRVRRAQYLGTAGGWSLVLVLALFTALGLSAKEDAALLPAYTACAEFAITAFRDRGGKYSRAAISTHVALLVVPMIAGLVWMLPRLLGGVAATRRFTIGERLLTEPRVLVDYIHWTLLPNLSALTFYHDDVTLSRGLFDPPSTAAAIAALALLIGVALWQRRARPLFCLGILWFFAGHSMTGTIIPLELVFEHRNYFPSIGLLLAAGSLVAFEPGVPLAVVRRLVPAAFIALFAITTFARAQEWSHPLRLAYAEALKRPDSPRAQYELAHALILADRDATHTEWADKARELLERTANLPDSGISAWQALIYLNARSKQPIDPRWWQAMVARLRTQTPSKTDISAIIFLYRCQRDGNCPLQPHEMMDTFVAALEKSSGDLNLLSAYAEFALLVLGDAELSVRMARTVVASAPNEPTYRMNLVRLLIGSGQYDAADAEIAELAKLNHLGNLDELLARLHRQLEEAKAHAADPATTPNASPGAPA